MKKGFVRVSFILCALLLSRLGFTQESFSLRSLAEALISKVPDEDDVCREPGSVSDTRPENQQYRCNEYPFGKTNLGISPKNFDKIKKPSADDLAQSKMWHRKKRVFAESIEVKGKSLPFIVYANRFANNDNFELGETRVLEFSDGKKVRDTLRASRGLTYFQVRTDEKGRHDIVTETCTFFPGLTLTGQTASQSWTKSYWLFDAKAKVTIDPGNLSFDHMRICTTVAFDKEDLATPLNVLKVEEPRIMGMKRTGMDVNVDGNWLMNVGDFFSSLTSSKSITDRIAELIEDKGNDYIKKKLRNGEYLDGLLKPVYSRAKSLADNKVNSANKTLRKEITAAIYSTCMNVLDTNNQMGRLRKDFCVTTAASPAFRKLVTIRILNENDREIASTPWIRVNRYHNPIADSFQIEVDATSIEARILSSLSL
jgi:hypothetical protein